MTYDWNEGNPSNNGVKWLFEDLALDESYVFEINPNEGGSPQYKKNITYQDTIAGNTLIFEGGDQAIETSVSGTLLSQSQHETFVDWFSKRHLIRLTDDLGRTYMIYITGYEPKRVRAVQARYKHTYTLSYTIVG